MPSWTDGSLDEFILLALKEISIFIMTSSIDPADIEMAKK
jgi:hypothetical protein